jgi:hypothetical protein
MIIVSLECWQPSDEGSIDLLDGLGSLPFDNRHYVLIEPVARHVTERGAGLE